jgi:hypothetical protein
LTTSISVGELYSEQALRRTEAAVAPLEAEHKRTIEEKQPPATAGPVG